MSFLDKFDLPGVSAMVALNGVRAEYCDVMFQMQQYIHDMPFSLFTLRISGCVCTCLAGLAGCIRRTAHVTFIFFVLLLLHLYVRRVWKYRTRPCRRVQERQIGKWSMPMFFVHHPVHTLSPYA